MKAQNNVFTIPAGIAFSRALAKTLLDNTNAQPEALSQIRIFLPTRRACRVLQDALLDESNGRPLILPKLQPIGDIDEEELSLSIIGQNGLDDLLNLPPGISPLKRRILLSRTIMAMKNFRQGPDHALALAESLGHLMDQIYTENLSLKNLDTLVPEEFAEHWQITIDFLKILSEHWPKILEENGVIDQADRRNRLILNLSQHWRNAPPQYPVIAAGSTGSIPATAELLSVIANLPQGQVILPGLDQNVDQESWDALEDTHPQFGFKLLLSQMDVDYKTVRVWNDSNDKPISKARRALSTEIMRPAETTGAWTVLSENKELSKHLEPAFEDLSYFQCEHEHEEAMAIAIALRETLETPGTTAALVTPDRNLARRVRAICKRWDINLDDSAGENLDQTPLGIFLKLSLETALNQAAPTPLLALLRNQKCRIAERSLVDGIEKHALRGLKPAPGFNGIIDRLQEKEDRDDAIEFLQSLESTFAPLLSLSDGYHAFSEFLNVHIKLAETLSGEPTLWVGESGEAAAKFLAELSDQAHLMQEMSIGNYRDIFSQLLKTISVRPTYGTHPRLLILGQLEARLLNTDLVILSGLNEGTWPQDPGHDPWMSRPMRKTFGLPSAERSLGLAAHDFVQGFCAPRVILTRSKRVNGTPSVPARWLQRFATVIDAAALPKDKLTQAPYQQWAKSIDEHETEAPYKRPEPRPPVEKRPQQLPATRIETWLKDPYSIYARYVLKLKKLDPLEQSADAAIRGTLLHDILERFVTAHPHELPQNSDEILQTIAKEEIERHHDDPAVWSFWWPRFNALSTWFLDHEKSWRNIAKPLKIEAEGSCKIQAEGINFTLTAKADRIDKAQDGAAIIDYKSGGTYTQKAIKSGDLPQLSIEGLIVSKGGFENIDLPVSSLGYWTLTGGSTPGKITQIDDNIDEILERTEAGIQTLIATFSEPETPYYALPCPDRAPRFNDYEHLARIKEWTALGESDSAEAA